MIRPPSATPIVRDRCPLRAPDVRYALRIRVSGVLEFKGDDFGRTISLQIDCHNWRNPDQPAVCISQLREFVSPQQRTVRPAHCEQFHRLIGNRRLFGIRFCRNDEVEHSVTIEIHGWRFDPQHVQAQAMRIESAAFGHTQAKAAASISPGRFCGEHHEPQLHLA